MGTCRLRVLHLSDLHERVVVSTTPEERRRKIHLGQAARHRVLGSNFHEVLRELGEIHLVCFTGDVADFGLPEEYAAATPRIDAILDTVHVPRERFFVVPGNHDVCRGIHDEAWGQVREVMREDGPGVSEWMAGAGRLRGVDESARDAILERSSAFRTWLRRDMGRDCLSPDRSPHGRLGHRVTLDDLGFGFPIHIIGLDSAWLSGDKHDQGKLALTTGQVDLLSTDDKGQPLPGFRLAMVHHPLTDLRDGAECRRRLADTVDILLRGHQHEEVAEQWEDPDRRLRILAAGSLYEGDHGDRWVNGFHVLEVELGDEGRPLSYSIEFRGWSPKGCFWHRDNAVYRKARDGRLRWSTTPGTDEDVEHPEPKRAFVGRDAELQALEDALLPKEGEPKAAVVCNLQGMAGVGKTWLVEQFCAVHHDALPGRRIPLVLSRAEETSVEALLGRLADELRLAGSPGDLRRVVPEVLRAGGDLVHLDNVDSRALADVAADLVDALPGLPVVVSGRYAGFQERGRWRRIPVIPFEMAQGLEQLAAELDPDTAQRTPEVDRERLVGALGGLPLAIHLAAGWLKAGYDVDRFLALMRKRKLSIEPFSPSDSDYRDRADRALDATFDVSLTVFRQAAPKPRSRIWALCALSEGPCAGFGLSLGASLAGVDEDDALDLLVRAVELSLVERVPAAERPDGAWRVHPLLAEHLRNRLGTKGSRAARVRLGTWFRDRVDEGDEDTRAARWAEVDGEGEGLVEWLAGLPPEESRAAASEGYEFALTHGPYQAWMAAASRGLEGDPDYAWQSRLLWVLGNLAFRAGDFDRALECAERKKRLERAEGKDREFALALGLRADVLYDRGELDEALRIRLGEQLPVYERLGDVRLRAVTMGRIADILHRRGELDEALRVRREEQLPVYERLRDVRSRAVAMRRIADILYRRGELDEALRIHREEGLLVFERLGDVRQRALTMGRVASILCDRGELDEALRIRREEQLPVFKRLGDVRQQAVTMRGIADILYQMGALGEALQTLRQEALPVFERLRDVRERALTTGSIADILSARGELEEALWIRREESLSAFEQLGDARWLLVGRTKLATTLLKRGALGDREEAVELLRMALDAARRMRLPRECEWIEGILRSLGEDV